MVTRLFPPAHPRAALIGLASVFAAASFSLFAQAPAAPTPAPTAPPAATPAAPPGTTAASTAQTPGRAGGGGAAQDNTGADFSPRPPIQARTGQAQAETFLLPAGYRMELVLTDPDIISPGVIEFDGNGRMYVAELRTYMPDGTGEGQHAPTSVISRWESTKGDGRYDAHTVFVDNLVLPRMILPLDNDSILVNETQSDDVVKWTDTNNDGVADRREVFYSGVGLGRDGNLEHEQSGFVWGLDNWIYSTYNAFRFRWTPNGILREPTGPNGGQWGLTQDDDGKMWWVNAGGERGPVNFQIPIQYGAFSVPDQFEPGFDVVWPVPSIGDMQGGMRRVRAPIGALNHFTAATGAEIVRGHRVPEDLRGDLLFAEPVGRLLRRTKIVKTEGLTQLRNAYPGSEFVLGTDPLFRPVNMRTGPDGTIYVADLYHGIVQEAQFLGGPTSYIRQKIAQYQLDRIVSHGRIWRLRYDGVPATVTQPAIAAIELDNTPPRMLRAPATQLVTHLDHPNGFWRDTAQRLIVLRQDKSIVPALQRLVRSSDNLVARFHALWSLEGLGALDASLVRQEMKDPNPRMRVQALRASETLYKAGDKSFAADYADAAKDADADVAIQAMLTLNVLKAASTKSVVEQTMASNKARGVQEIGKWLASPPPSAFTDERSDVRGGTLSPEQRAQLQRGQTIYTELCYACHGDDGRGAPLQGGAPGATMAPPVAGSPRVQGHRDYVTKVLLQGLTGPLGDRTFTEVMVPMGAQTDEWVAAIGSFVRNSFGNRGSFITPADVARVRKMDAGRKSIWTLPELEASLPVMLPAGPDWVLSASHRPEAAARGVTLAGWSSGAPQQPGMWFQVELPAPAVIAEVHFDAAAAGRLGGGGRGRGAAAAGRGGAVAAGRGVAVAAALAPAPGFPREFQIHVSMDGKSFGAPVAKGPGSSLTLASFAPVRARFVRITQTAAAAPDAPAWSIQNLRIFQAPTSATTTAR